jgi:uncharacterized delta-60 repeat protein
MKRFKQFVQILLVAMPFFIFGQTYNVDLTFNVGNTGPNGYIRSMVKQPDGKIIVCGFFTTYQGVARNQIARLNTDGTLDVTFNPGSGPFSSDSSQIIRDVAIDSNGKILASGYFSSFNGATRNCLVRLNSDGSVDTSFNGNNLIGFLGGALTKRINAIEVLPDGKLVIGGIFNVSGFSNRCLARLNTNGSYDSSFIYTSNTFQDSPTINDVEIQNDGKIVIAISNGFRDAVMRFNQDGSRDISFNIANFYGAGYKILIDSDNKIFLGGLMRLSNDDTLHLLLKFDTDGSLNSDFTHLPAQSGSSTENVVYSIKKFGDKILIGGNLNFFDGVINNRIIRLNSNGLVDDSFVTGSGANNIVYTVDVDDNNRILLSGSFSLFNGAPAKAITRLVDEELSLPDSQLDKFSFYNNHVGYFFDSPNLLISEITIFDITGKKLHIEKGIHHPTFSVINNFARGVKVFKVVLIDRSEKTFMTVD